MKKKRIKFFYSISRINEWNGSFANEERTKNVKCGHLYWGPHYDVIHLLSNYFKYNLEFYQSQDIKQIQEDLLSKDLDMIPFLPINLAPYNDSMLQWNIGRWFKYANGIVRKNEFTSIIHIVYDYLTKINHGLLSGKIRLSVI